MWLLSGSYMALLWEMYVVCVVGTFLSESDRQRGGDVQEMDSSQMAAVTRGGAGVDVQGT